MRLEGQLVLAAYVDGAAMPGYFIMLEFQDGQVQAIRDFRYVTYIAAEAEIEGVDPKGSRPGGRAGLLADRFMSKR